MNLELPPSIRSEIKLLEDEVYDLQQMIDLLEEFTLLSEDEFALLNRYAKRTLLASLPAVVESIVIRISRLTEPALACGHNNLTLGSLVHSCRAIGKQALADEAETKFFSLKREAEVARELHRNKRYAHRDYEQALGPTTLPPLSLPKLQCLVAGMAEYLNIIRVTLTDSSFDFRADPSGNLKSLIATLQRYESSK